MSTNFIGITIVIILSSIFLFTINYKTRLLEIKLEQTNYTVIQQVKEINALNAEWSYLTSPSRLNRLLKQYFPNMKVISPAKIIKFKDLAESKNRNLSSL